MATPASAAALPVPAARGAAAPGTTGREALKLARVWPGLELGDIRVI